MKKIFYLKSCSTNRRILKQINPGSDVILQDIKEKNIDEQTLDMLRENFGSYEALFSKKANKYRLMGLNKLVLQEKDYKRYLLEEYTFLKRPFILNDEEFFIGNSEEVVQAAIKSFKKSLE